MINGQNSRGEAVQECRVGLREDQRGLRGDRRARQRHPFFATRSRGCYEKECREQAGREGWETGTASVRGKEWTQLRDPCR